jgi:hypothetical protein
MPLESEIKKELEKFILDQLEEQNNFEIHIL